jgi:hypothetical protein
MPEPVMLPAKMTPVDAKMFESVAYLTSGRKLFIKFRNQTVRCYEGVPGFRYQGLLSSPRKDGYFSVYIRDQFLMKEVAAPSL